MVSTEPRETSGTTTTLLLRYVREQGGDRAVSEVLARAGVRRTAEELQDASRWISYDTRIALFEAATEVLGDPRATFEVGATAATHGLHQAIVPLLRAFGSAREVYRQLPRVVPKFTTTSTMDLVESSATHAVLHYRLHEGYRHSRLDCAYAQGLFSAVPTMFGLPPAQVVHEECESDGFPACVYQVSWAPRRRWWALRGGSRGADMGLAALRMQVEEFQLAAADLVSSDDVEDVLTRIVGRAAAAVLAPAYLLVVQATDGGEPLVRGRGLAADRSAMLASRLLRGEDLGPSAVVVDIASTRHVHGRLAALYSAGHHPLEGDRSLLEAYAQHAAAALDLLTALEASRREASRTAALLTLAHELATADTAESVADVVAAALPRIVGCRAAAVLLWDPVLGALQAIASSGHEPAEQELLLAMQIRADQTPELVDLLAHHSPVLVETRTASPELAALLTAIGTRSIIAVPLLAGDTLMGVAAASWRTVVGSDVRREAIARIAGVSDHAATALQNARLLSTVRHQAHHDSLTGLPNRVLFTQRLDATLRAGDATTTTAVLFCDLDHFKAVNDDLGHSAGDELLRQVAARLRVVVRAGDTVGRLSGDEFAVVVNGATGEREATAAARRMVDCLNVPFRIEGQEVRITASVGISLHVGEDGRGDRLLAAADTAMYEAKKSGRNQVALAGETTRTPPGASLQSELAAALSRDELLVYFQPVVDVTVPGANRVVGAEALLRWEHPRLGLLNPGAFVPLAEETGLITELDLWVVGAACAALARWPQPAGRALHVAVNLAAATLVDPRLLPTVRAALSRHGLTPCRLVLEVVESRSLVDLGGVVERLIELRRLGVRISLDDFGTGYSTLAWLNTLPVDQIKIDRTFVAALPDGASLALVRGVLALAKELGVEVIAEGVETPDQLAALREAGCELVQGNLLGRAVPAHPSTPAALGVPTQKAAPRQKAQERAATV